MGIKKIKKGNESGFSLVETVVGVAVFVIIAFSIYQTYIKILELVSASRAKIEAVALATEQFEIIRNLPYADVGVQGGIPNGKLKASQSLTRGGFPFTVDTTIRNIDDPFDGTLGGTPNDLSPADYKSVELDISCAICKNFQPISITGQVAPKNLEAASTNGSLFISVIDANGQPVSGANVHIENNQQVPAIVIDDVTNASGMLQVVDAPPGDNAYEITVSKAGYSTDKTYLPGDVANPNPTKPHATVVQQQLTQITFAIDKVSTINVSSVTDSCVPVGSVSFSVDGSKFIGTSPDVLKYTYSGATDASGINSLSNLEWDTYNFSFTDTTYNFAGSIPLMLLSLLPDSSQDIKLVVSLKGSGDDYLVSVKDAGTGLPLTGATVTLDDGSSQTSLTTNEGFLRQTDWSGGAGQTDFVDVSRYFASDSNIDTASPSGELKLVNNFGIYDTDGILVSSSFDLGPTGVNLGQILWQSQSQPVETGTDSVKFQIATNDDDTTWDFLGPDGTASTYYTTSNYDINSINNGKRYLKYKIFMHTDDTGFTPDVSEISITFSSNCIPPGQVLFKSLPGGLYTLTVSKTGYNTFTDDTINISSPWSQNEVLLSP